MYIILHTGPGLCGLKNNAKLLGKAWTKEKYPLVVGECGVAYLLLDQLYKGHQVIDFFRPQVNFHQSVLLNLVFQLLTISPFIESAS